MADAQKPVEQALLWQRAGTDRFGEPRRFGISQVDCKVSRQDGYGVLVFEIAVSGRGGPERHRHLAQDEWFYVLAGEFLFEIGGQQVTLRPGDSTMAPRQVSHAWAALGPAGGKLLIVFNPPGDMEAFFRTAANAAALPGRDPAFWEPFGLEWLGPPLLAA